MVKVLGILGLAWLAACGSGSDDGPDGLVALDARDGGGATVDGAADATAACEPTTPTTEVCDGLDNDCDGRTDDVDTGGDGFFDCAEVAIFGSPAGGAVGFTVALAAVGVRVVRVQDDVVGGTPPLTEALLAPFDVIVLDRLLRAYSADESAALAAWVTGGGGLVVMSGHFGAIADVNAANDLLARVGLELAPALVNGPVTSFVAHPVTTGLTTLPFMGGHTIAAVADVVGGVNTAIATLAGAPVGIVQRRGAGRVVVWGDEWISYDVEWPALQVQAFWRHALAWVGHLE